MARRLSPNTAVAAMMLVTLPRCAQLCIRNLSLRRYAVLAVLGMAQRPDWDLAWSRRSSSWGSSDGSDDEDELRMKAGRKCLRRSAKILRDPQRSPKVLLEQMRCLPAG
jgi:hypothetical protein